MSWSDDESVQHEPDHEPEAMHEEEVPEYYCPHYYFARELQRVELPHDGPAQGAFDNRSDFVLGDPGAHFGTFDYLVSGAKGMPHWSPLFRYLLLHFEHVRWLRTVFVLVDNRDLTEPSTPHESLSHWPTVEAWWKRRLTMYGPAEKLCDLLYIPISQEVHPTWAGTFVLAALSFLFPGLHLILLHSDCVPVTLFEVADLWKEVSLLRTCHSDHAAASCQNLHEPSQFSTESAPNAPKLGRQELQQTEIGQGILLVTEHNAEINAGFIVVFGSKHAAPIDEARWRSIYAGTQAPVMGSTLQREADRLEQLYWAKVKDLLDTRKSVSAMSNTECAAVLHSLPVIGQLHGLSLVSGLRVHELFPPQWPSKEPVGQLFEETPSDFNLGTSVF